VLREQLSLRGIPIRLNDTAGLRDSQDPVEQEGVRRAWEEIGKADVVIFLVDANRGFSAADQLILDRLHNDSIQLVYSKCDLLADDQPRDEKALYISTLSGEGIETLIQRITGESADYNQDNQAIMARRRHVDALIRARDSVEQALQVFVETRSGELMAEDLRDAQRQLNEITGEFSSEDLLGKIFSTFCIGK
jgi:tRNA modification GTPase